MTSGGGLGKFSEIARRVLSLAQEEAKRLGHAYIGSEHILLGLLREKVTCLSGRGESNPLLNLGKVA